MARILGINRTQDGSISLFENGSHKFSIHKERITGKKHHWGKLGDIQLYIDYYPNLKSQPIDTVVQCFSSDKELDNLSIYREELKKLLSVNDDNILDISHHLAHAYSAFYPTGFEEAVIIILDSVGSKISNLTEVISEDLNKEEFEVSSVYFGSGSGIKCISKQSWDGNKLKPKGLGQFYFFLTQCFFRGEGKEGKVMGLSSYGDPNKLDLPKLIVENGSIFIPNEWTSIFQDKESFNFHNGVRSFQDKANLAAIGQKVFEDALVKFSIWALDKTGAKKICYAGGCALNCVANSRLLEIIDLENIFIPPAPHDGGTSLGCAIYGVQQLERSKYSFSWNSDYLGAKTVIEVKEYLSNHQDLKISKPKNIENEVASLIESGEVIALFQNKSEFGPRALGHRSLIGNARFEITKCYINSILKNREWFRPIAPIVLEEDTPAYFDFKGKSPHMLFIANLKTEFYSKFKAIEHVDFTSRIQTVSPDEDSFLYRLLCEYKAISGDGVLTNTSLNGEERPIVETFSDALVFLMKHKINYLIFPPFIIEKRNKAKNLLTFKSVNQFLLE